SDPALDYSLNFNTSLVSSDSKTGMALYGFHRNRDPYDANGDDFSEVSDLNNTTVGTRLFHRFGYRNKMAIDFFTINEERRGGNKFDLPKHEADIAEAIDHKITTGAISFDQFFRDEDKLSVFVSGQFVDRDSYYGAGQSMKDYGKTQGFTTNLGVQYNAVFTNSNLLSGIEYRGETLEDKKLGHPDYDNAEFVSGELVIPHTENMLIADQVSDIYSVFAQYDRSFNKVNISLGARYDNYEIKDETHDSNKSGNVISPRLTVKYDMLKYLQARVSYSQGYRAPQVFDEDLHIETSGSRKVIHENDPDLKQETSHSYMASLDFNKLIGKVNTGLLIEGFYTQLNDAFANEFSDPDANGVVTYTRINAESGPAVQGVNLELNIVPTGDFSFAGGFTFQKSEFEDAQEFDKKAFFRTPNQYG
ncbi:MAG: TonB-dependent receptor, partial [Bacteroidales bacterium]|nr:TonB-dependent receptor [Bacteroidales bacterium]